MQQKESTKKKEPSFPISVFFAGQVLQLGEKKNEDAKATKGFLG